MLTALYLILSVLFAYLIWQTSSIKKNNYALLLLLVLIGLFYDTFIIGIGSFIGEGDLLKTLNAGRFYVHALLTPTMIIFGFGILRKAGVKWAQNKTAHIMICVFATLLISLGAYSDILQLDLQTKTITDILRYINEGGMKGPPIPAVLTIIFLIVAGISLWRNTSWKWLAVGAVLMFIAAGAGMGDKFYIGNVGEVILGFTNVYTARKFLT
ncbi:MAG TPA: hypothetical protein VLA72_06830 [Anaerolineales bacterium]|nr:hypothetical protein [Anaerolineales bacterium]